MVIYNKNTFIQQYFKEENTHMKELTKGKPYKVLIFFALPILMSNIFQKIYNITDSKIVSLFISPDCLAAVGSTEYSHCLVVKKLSNDSGI